MTKIDRIVEVLLDSEEHISDGYVYYCDDIIETLKKNCSCHSEGYGGEI